jgi:GT2 family glycosyltransferase
MKQESLVGVIVVSYNSGRVIGELLDSLPAACGPVRYRTIVVDNGSMDGSVDLLQNRPEVSLVRSQNFGYAAGINRGIAVVPDATCFLILNPDTRLHPGCVPALMSALTINHAGIAVPKVLTPDGRVDRSLRREPSIWRALGLTRTRLSLFSENLMREEDYEDSRAVDWALGAVMLVSAQCAGRVGPWDETYFLYSEETDFCLRARDLGYSTWFEPAAVATHIGGASGTSHKTQTLRAMNSVRLYRRRHSVVLSVTYFLFTLLREILWGCKRRDMTVARAMVRPSLRPSELRCSDRLIPR